MLSGGDRKSPVKYTPLPLSQIAILLLLRFCESASTFVILPFLNELLTCATGGDEEKVGYYAGLMDAIRQLASLVTVMFWSRLSDHIGRKPILMLGTLALAISNLSFGLSRTFWALVVSRCIFTAFNSNTGVIKSIVGEITDQTNSADAFAMLHVPWAIGTAFGALIGGSLARPHDHFPEVFHHHIWIKYPYFLPCAVLAVVTLMAVAVIAVYLNETVRGGYFSRVTRLRRGDASEPLLGSSRSGIPTTTVNEEPVPLKHLLNFRVLLPVTSYVCLASLHASSNAVQPLFLAMPVDIGGLDLTPRSVGFILGTYGIANSIFQIVMLGRLVRRFGVKTIFVTSISAFIPIYTLSPVMNLLVRRNGFSYVVWIVLGCQLSSSLVMELGYGCVYMYITAAAPNKRSLGATHGLSQTLVSIGRIITPAIANSLLAFSIQYDILWGYAAYVFLVFITIGGIALASKLPKTLNSNDY
ncbi:member of major facilitator superfamily multidrug-resistance, DHA1 sub-family [Phlegmacium glaucopus]|nr:member of major facilitator superfamily multidrug-resistance, DHA1 sub-family [Phlegmacium glaucopus]